MVYFCPREDCVQPLVDLLDSAEESIHCAVYELDLEPLQQKLVEKSQEIEVQVVTDDHYLKEFNHPFVKIDGKNGLMHNKFCVIDNLKIYTGSMNPTNNCAFKNNNNLLVIESKVLAQNYEAEFQEMWKGIFKKGDKVLNPLVLLQTSPDTIKIKNYFCPEDQCESRIKEELYLANKSIYFLTFSFTSDSIANVLLNKNTREGVEVRGVMEAGGSNGEMLTLLNKTGFEAVKDANKYKMHHKVFIIDEKIVITGSMNPTGNGNRGNDENILIIESEEIAKRFKEEFDWIYGEVME